MCESGVASTGRYCLAMIVLCRCGWFMTINSVVMRQHEPFIATSSCMQTDDVTVGFGLRHENHKGQFTVLMKASDDKYKALDYDENKVRWTVV